MNATTMDAVYYFVLDQTSTVSFNTCSGTCFDTVLYVRDVCTAADSEQKCNDDATNCAGCATSTGDQSRVSVQLSAGAHYLIVDTFANTPCGAFTVTPGGVPQ